MALTSVGGMSFLVFGGGDYVGVEEMSGRFCKILFGILNGVGDGYLVVSAQPTFAVWLRSRVSGPCHLQKI